MKLKAVLEVEFDSDIMIDEETLNNEWAGDMLTYMKWLYKEEGFGIFDNKVKLVGVHK